jgi:hypothetical protein
MANWVVFFGAGVDPGHPGARNWKNGGTEVMPDSTRPRTPPPDSWYLARAAAVSQLSFAAMAAARAEINLLDRLLVFAVVCGDLVIRSGCRTS